MIYETFREMVRISNVIIKNKDFVIYYGTITIETGGFTQLYRL